MFGGPWKRTFSMRVYGCNAPLLFLHSCQTCCALCVSLSCVPLGNGALKWHAYSFCISCVSDDHGRPQFEEGITRASRTVLGSVQLLQVCGSMLVLCYHV